MEPGIENPAEENPEDKWQAQQEARERAENLRKATLEKCLAACESGDIIQLNNHVEESLGKLSKENMTTLLERTIAEGWLEGIRCLLEHGADPNTMLWITTLRKYYSLDLLKLLAEYGMNYNSGENALEYVIDQREVLDWLLDHGLDINRRGNRELVRGHNKEYGDRTVAVLDLAAAKGNIDLFDYLVARGAKFAQSNALVRATASQNAAAMITHLVDTYHFDVNASDECGGLNEQAPWIVTPVYPLNYAVTYDNIPAIETLLKYGADIQWADSIAIGKKNIPALKLLLEAGADPSRNLCYTIRKDFLEGAQLCLEYGGDITLAKVYYEEEEAKYNHTDFEMSNEMEKLLDEWK
ncbi:ankyrin repeat-containing domain protein [Xylogone sp. PMI_703]|nr:ankyrin repeat-containing domain protein [Xylogone sp. PMI_703]